MTPSRGLQLAAVTAFVISGVTGLLYENLWSRELGLLLGSSAWAHTAVLGAFMAGLGLGNALLGPRADRARSPLALYATLEFLLGLWGLGSPWLFLLLGDLYRAAGVYVAQQPASLQGLKLALGLVAVLPPAVLMGGTLPALGRWLTQRSSQIGTRVGLLYFLNTAGAVLGCALGGFYVVEQLGLDDAMRATALVNLALGASLWAADRLLGQAHAPLLEALEAEPAPEPAPEPARYSAPQIRAALLGAALGGALSMLYELVWIRMVGFVFGSSSQSFSVMLMTFIAGIALGGLLAARWLRREPDALAAMALCQLGAAAAVLAVLPLYERAPWVFAWLRDLTARTPAGFTAMQGLQVAMLCAVMLLPTTLMGASLPLASRVAVRQVDRLGAGVGQTFAANTAGTLLGVLATTALLMPWLGIQGTLYLGVASTAALGLWLGWRAGWLRGRRLGITSAVAALLCALVFAWQWPWDPILLTAGFFRGKSAPESFEAMRDSYADHKLLYSKDGVDTTVTVFSLHEEVYLKVNGKTDASTLRGDMVTQTMSGHLPMLLHPTGAREVLVIGLGSGVTAGAVLQHEGAHVRIVELSQAVVEGARHFSHVNHGVLDDPRAQLHLGDARDLLWLDTQRYDAIISEPSNPWISGVANLFTQEFFQAASARLRPGGLYVQWIQLYAFPEEALERTLRTIQSAFPHVTVWRFTRADALMVASNDPIGAPDALWRRLREPSMARALGPDAPLPVPEVEDLLVHQVLSARGVKERFSGPGLRNTDRAPYLEFAAPRGLFLRKSPKLLERLDDRLQPDRAASLLMGRSALKPATAQRLALALERAGSPDLALRLRGAAWSREPDIKERLRQGFADQQTVPAFLAWVDQLRDPQGPALSREDCDFATERLSAHHQAWSTAFTLPAPERLTALTQRCAQAWPASSGPWWIRLAAARFIALDYEATLTWARRALEQAALSQELRLDALRLLGRAALLSDQGPTALEAYRAVLKLRPQDKEARQVLRLP